MNKSRRRTIRREAQRALEARIGTTTSPPSSPGSTLQELDAHAAMGCGTDVNLIPGPDTHVRFEEPAPVVRPPREDIDDATFQRSLAAVLERNGAGFQVLADIDREIVSAAEEPSPPAPPPAEEPRRPSRQPRQVRGAPGLALVALPAMTAGAPTPRRT